MNCVAVIFECISHSGEVARDFEKEHPDATDKMPDWLVGVGGLRKKMPEKKMRRYAGFGLAVCFDYVQLMCKIGNIANYCFFDKKGILELYAGSIGIGFVSQPSLFRWCGAGDWRIMRANKESPIFQKVMKGLNLSLTSVAMFLRILFKCLGKEVHEALKGWDEEGPNLLNSLGSLLDASVVGLILDYGVVNKDNQQDGKLQREMGANVAEVIGSLCALTGSSCHLAFVAGFKYAAIPMLINNGLDASATIAAAVTSEFTPSSFYLIFSIPLPSLSTSAHRYSRDSQEKKRNSQANLS